MKIFISLTDDIDELSRFLLESENNLFYSSLKYCNFLSQLLNSELYYFVAKNQEGEIVGSLPVMLSGKGQCGKIANSLPYYGSNGCAVLKNNLPAQTKKKIFIELMNFTYKMISENECAASTFISNPLDDGVNEWMKSCGEYDFWDMRIGQITPLPERSGNLDEKLMKMFYDPRPRNIRKAIKEQIECRISHSSEDMDFLYQTHHQNISSIGGIPKSRDFFTKVMNFFSKTDFRIYVAECGNKKIAVLLLFYYNKTVEYYTPATIEEFRNMQPSALLIYRAMLDAVGMGYKYWNWGGTWVSQTGVYDFKKKWAAKDYPYYYYTKIFNKEILNLPKEVLLKEYPNFFVLPFDKLSRNDKK